MSMHGCRNFAAPAARPLVTSRMNDRASMAPGQLKFAATLALAAARTLLGRTVLAPTVLRRAALACVLGATAAVSACGFRLAGSDPLPGVLARPYLSVKDPYTDFASEFAHQLKASGAVVQETRAKSTVTIEVTKDTVERRTLSVSARNIPTEYELTYTVTFSVEGAQGELLKAQTINVTKDFSFVEQELLAKEHESDILRRQMGRDLVAIAMRRLSSLK